MKQIYLDINNDTWRMVFDLKPDNSIDEVLEEITNGKVIPLDAKKKKKSKEKANKPKGNFKATISFKKIKNKKKKK